MLELRNISKSFPGVRALDDVSLTFRAGEIHGLVGENGAGKSTAIKIITGIHAPDAGGMSLAGAEFRPVSFRAAVARGIGIVHQELSVIPDAAVAENIMLNRLVARRLGVIDWPATEAAARRHMKRVGLDVPGDRLVRGLSAPQKQLLQIAKALASDVRVLLLDEPTSTLTEHEVRRLLVVVRELKARGVAIVFVSHKFDEVFEWCDRISVLRDGRFVGTRETAQTTPRDVVQLMLGRASNDDHLGRLAPDWNEPVLQVRNLVRRGRIDDVSFTLHRGEVLGFYGLVGSGRTDEARAIIGEEPIDAGTIYVRGKATRVRSVGDGLYRHRLGYVSENRKEEGVFLHDSVRMNLTLPIPPRLRSAFTGAIDSAREDEVARRPVHELGIRITGLMQPVGQLSGGNQQKVSIAKWLNADCDILIIDEPTIGVDVGAKQQIHQLIWDLAARAGKSVIVISSDLPEIVRLASRVLVFRAHRIVGEVRDIDVKPKSHAEVSEEIAPCFA